jgi:hypothetical protein
VLVLRAKLVTPEIEDHLFLGFLYPLARDGWLADDAEAPELDDLPVPYWPKHHRFISNGDHYSAADPTLAKKALELEAAYSSYGPSRSEPFASLRRDKTVSSSAPMRRGPAEDEDGAKLRQMIWLWFANRRRLGDLLEKLEPEKRRQRVRAIRCDPRFIQLRHIAARLEGVNETLEGLIELERREQERLRELSKREKRERIQRLLKREPGLSNRVLASIFKCSPQSVWNYRDELEKAGEIPVLDTRRDALGRRQPARKRAVLDTSTSETEAA